MPNIPTLPPYPSRGSAPDTFSLQADAFVAAMPNWGVQVQAVGDQAAADAATAAAQAVAAASAAGTAGAIKWVSGTTYAVGDARYSPADLQTYRRKTDGAGTLDPSADPTNWAPVNLQATLARSARTSNTALAMADRSTLIDITSGTFTQTFSPASELSNGWYCWIRNSGTGVVTLDPNASELIDGLTSYAMYPSETRLVICTGAAFYTVLLTGFKLEPASTMTFIEPPGYRAYEVFLAAPGGGGGSGRVDAASTNRGGGGGGKGGTTNWAIVRAQTPGASITLTVGANGTGGAAQTTNSTDGNAGTAGGNHSFGSLLYAAGGEGGYAGVLGTASGGAVTPAPLGMVPSPSGGNCGDGGNGAAGTASPSQTLWASTGGGGGGAINISNTAFSGGAAGPSGTTNSSTQLLGGIAGVAGGTRPGGNGAIPKSHRAGTGGGGGAAHATAAGAAGGDGYHGGGGGGGSAAVNGQSSGAGGTGYGYYYVGGLF